MNRNSQLVKLTKQIHVSHYKFVYVHSDNINNSCERIIDCFFWYLRPSEIVFYVCRLVHLLRLHSFVHKISKKISVDPCLVANGLENCTNNCFIFLFDSNSTIYLIKYREGVSVFVFCAFNGTATKQSLECFHISPLDSKDVPIISSPLLFAALDWIISFLLRHRMRGFSATSNWVH